MALSFPNLGRNDPMRRASDFSLGTPVNQPMPAPATMPRSKSMFGGVLDYMGQQNPQTGLSRAEGFAAALDPLVMPSMRSGEAIRQRGAQRMSVSQANKTVEWLRKNGYAELATVVENNPAMAPAVMSEVLKKRMEGPPPVGGDFKDAQALRKEFTSLPRIKNFSDVSEAYTRIVASAKDPSPAGDLSLIFNYMKVLDPGSVVRESEFAAAAKSGALGARIQAAVDQVEKGTRLSSSQRADFVDRATRLYKAQADLSQPIYDTYSSVAVARGFDPAKVIPQFGYSGELAEIAPKFEPMSIPPMPQGASADGEPLTQAVWERIWSQTSEEERRNFMETGSFE